MYLDCASNFRSEFKTVADARATIAGMNCPEGLGAQSEFCLTLKPRHGESVSGIFRRLNVAIAELDATITHLIVFGSVNASVAATAAMHGIFGNVDWPVTWAEGAACDDNPIAGLQVFAFGGSVRRIEHDGRIVGSVFEDGAARHCILGGIVPQQLFASRRQQTAEALNLADELLAQAGYSFADVMRTWFYLDDILSWYDEFNQARKEIYSQTKFRSGSWPASTGIGASNPSGAALVAGIWAVRPLNSSVRVTEVASPLQCPAPAYGSAFSRAMEIASASGRRLSISGTASIAPAGHTLWLGDTRKQITLTMEVVEAILHSRGFGFVDVTRATAYFKNRADVAAFAEWCAARNLSLPAIAVHSTICRSDLLFELEADAWSQNHRAEECAVEFVI